MYRTILFDLDGTILDTNELIIQSFLHTFKGVTKEPLTKEHVIPQMGRPLQEQMKYFSGREQVDDLIGKYRKFNLEKHDEFVRLFPHVQETLQSLHKAGIKLGVVTSKIRLTTGMGLKLTGIYEMFGSIVTVDDVGQAKPHPEGILRALRELDAEAGTALMVGDSHYDIVAAHEAGVASAAVSWSLKGLPYLQSYEPTYIVDDIREILPIAGVEGIIRETN